MYKFLPVHVTALRLTLRWTASPLSKVATPLIASSQTCNPSSSILQLLELQVCTIMLVYCFFYISNFYV
jgi:hypothetical protein